MNNAREAFLARHNPSKSSSTDSHSSVATVTPGGLDRSSTLGTAVGGDPFADPASLSGKGKGKQVARSASQSSHSNPFSDANSKALPSRPVMEEEEEEDEDVDAPTTLHPPTAGALGLARPARYPTPKPLGLSLTELQNGRTTMAIPAPPPRAPRTQRRPDEEDLMGEEGPAESGRWWTDWLCGCREGPDRGGDHQVRTSFFTWDCHVADGFACLT